MSTPKNRRVLRLPAVIAKTGLGRDSIYRGAREGWLCKPIKLSERASGWFEDELDDYLEQRAAKRTQPDQASAPQLTPPHEPAPLKAAGVAPITKLEARPVNRKLRSKNASVP
jgi:prophage regulatory protein